MNGASRSDSDARVALNSAEYCGEAPYEDEGNNRDRSRAARYTAVILETNPDGHRLQYVRHLVRAIGPCRALLVTTADVVGSPEFRTYLQPLGMGTVVVPGAPTRLRTLDRALRRALRCARTHRAEALIIPDGDVVLPLLPARVVGSLGRSFEIRLLLMRTQWVGRSSRRPAHLVKPLLVQLLRAVPGLSIHFLTDALGVIGNRRGYPGIAAVRDPIAADEPDGGAHLDGLPPMRAQRPGEVVIGVFGVITRRKNVDLVARAAAAVPEARLVIAGRLSTEVRRSLADDPQVEQLLLEQRLTVLDRTLSPGEFGSALAAVDVVAVLHDNDAPSGVLGEACLRRTPVLVPSGGWLARVVTATGVGIVTPLNVPAVADAIRQLRGDPAGYAAATRAYAARIGTEDFVRRLACVDSSTGRAVAGPRRQLS